MQTPETAPRQDSSLPSKNVTCESRPNKQSKPFQRGHWKKAEQQRYAAFMRKNYHIMRCSRLRYHFKIFNAMALEIGTRSSAQCKSHHQKMLKKVGYRIENLLLADRHSISMGEALSNHQEQLQIKQMVSQISTDWSHPYFMVQTGSKILIVVDERFVGTY